MILQAITESGGISAEWVLVGVVSFTGALIMYGLKRFTDNINSMLVKINDRLDKHDDKLNTNDTEHAKLIGALEKVIETNNISNSHQDEKLTLIFQKLDTISR